MSALCGPATEVVATREVGVKWCFRCRVRSVFTDTLRATVEPSYWEPFWTRRCERGHIDGDLFPGWSREWGDA